MKIQEKIETYLLPISTKISSSRFMQGLSGGMMASLPIMMVGAIFSILCNFPIESYQAFITSSGLSNIFNVAISMTTDIVAVYISFYIGRSFAKIKGYEKEAGMVGLMAVMGYFILVPYGMNEMGVKFFEFTYLGSQGIFVAMITGMITVFLYDVIMKKDITIKLPEGVPGNVMSAFTSIIPTAVVAIVFLLINFAFSLTPSGNVFTYVYSLLQAPLQMITGNIISMVVIVIVSQVLWFFGVHGSMVALSAVFPLWMSMYAENVTSYAANGTIVNPINVTMFDFTTLGGCGNALGLVILLLFFSKSKQNKTFGKLFIAPSLFNVVEPVIYSMPLMLNTTFLIPLILSPLVSLAIAYLGIIVIGIVPAPLGIMNLSFLPPIFRGIINCGIPGAILEVIIILSSILIYYPFFKMADKQALQMEQKNNEDNE